ncbi:MAG: hypothetical protein RIE53_12325 [Rhodothermales bacterium]
MTVLTAVPKGMVRWVLLVAVLVGSPLSVRAQVLEAVSRDAYHPMEAPVQSDLAPGINIHHVQASVLLMPEQRRLVGSAVYRVSVDATSTARRFILRAGAVDIRDVRVFSDSTRWTTSGDSLYIALPDGGAEEVVVQVDYETSRAGYDIRDRGGWKAAWTPSRADETHWIPAPLEWFDAYSADIRVTVPSGWDVFWPDGPNSTVLGPEATTHIWQPEGERLTHAVGFLAAESGFVTVEVDSTGGSTGRSIALPPGYPTQIWNGLRLESDPALLEDSPLMADLATRAARFQARFGSLQTNVFPTDAWLSRAIPVFAAAQALRQEHGDGAYGLILETARTRYLEEAERYVRPLIWDRWYTPSDLNDAHATWKGLWVLHMLAEEIGVERVLDAATDLDAQAASAAVDTETFRQLVGGRSAFFDTWVYGAGHPVFTLIYSHRPEAGQLAVILTQEQDGPLVPDVFDIHTDIVISSLAGLERHPVHLDANEVRFVYEAPLRPRYVHLDETANLLYAFSSDPDLDDVTSQLGDAQTAGGRIRSLSLLARGGAEPELIIGLRPALTGSGPYVLQAALPVLAGMAPSTSALRMVQEQSSATDPGVRLAWLRALAAWPGPAAAEEALRTANTSQNGFLLEEAVRILVERREDLAWSVLQSALVTDSDADRIRRAAIRLVERSSRGARERVAALLPLTENPHHPVTRGEALLAAARVEPGNATVRRRTAAWLPDALPALRAAAIAALDVLPDDAITPQALEAALALETRPALRRALSRHLP